MKFKKLTHTIFRLTLCYVHFKTKGDLHFKTKGDVHFKTKGDLHSMQSQHQEEID